MAALLAIGAVAICAWVRRAWASPYDAARRLDAAAGLHDRMSTALCFGNTADPSQMLLRQRQDALTRVSEIDLGRLFPICTPALARRALLLALLAGGMFAHCAHHQPLMMALLRASSRSHLTQTVFANRESAEEPRGMERNAEGILFTKTADVDDHAQRDVQGGPTPAKSSATPAKAESLVGSLLEALKGMASGDAARMSLATERTSGRRTAICRLPVMRLNPIHHPEARRTNHKISRTGSRRPPEQETSSEIRSPWPRIC